MDKAYWGTMHWGNFRWGVYNTIWDDALTILENASFGSGLDPAYWGSMRWGYFRWGVYYPLWDEVLNGLKETDVSNLWATIKKALAEVIDSTTFNVTRREVSLGSHATRDSWRGWRTKSYPVESQTTIDMVIVPKGATRLAAMAGFYPILDAAGRTADPVAVGDQILDSNGEYWDVEIVEKIYWGDSFVYRNVHMNKAIMYQADFGTATWDKTRARDPRYRTKDWMTNLRATQITKDDDSTLATFAVMFNEPPYPLELEYRHPTSPVQGLYVIDEPNDTPIRSGDQIIRNYEAHVPIHIMTIDSTGCSGDALAHKMTAELQYTCETHSTGSQRNLLPRRKNDRELGGMKLYDRIYELSYVRSASA